MGKRLFALILSVIGVATAMAQSAIPDTHLTSSVAAARRTEIVLPKVNGYTCYKADFHTHTMFSDGDLTPRQRIREAWLDGLDIVALTDHLEYRRQEQEMLNAHAPYNAEGKPHKYYPANIDLVKSDRVVDVKCDYDAVYEGAKTFLKNSGLPIMLVKGIELSREPLQLGHFSALFVKSINSIYDKDIKQALRNVHAQGGIVIHNHPAYRRTTSDKSELQKELYDEGLIDGVEIVNDMTFYPKIIRRAVEENLIMIGASDIHRPTSEMYKERGFYRTMTFILAKECTEKAIREALEKRRTIAYSGGQLMGEEHLLADFFNAAVDCRLLLYNAHESTGYYQFTNQSSMTFRINYKGTIYELKPFNALTIGYYVGDDPKTSPTLCVENMWHIDYQHPNIKVKLDK